MKRRLMIVATLSLLSSASLMPITVLADELLLSDTKDTKKIEPQESTQKTETSETTDSSTKETNSSEEMDSSSETKPTVDSPVIEEPAKPETPETPVKPEIPVISVVPESSEYIPLEEKSTMVVSNNTLTEELPTVLRNQTTESFIQSIGERARKIGQKYKLYASVMIAQAILESGSGSSKLSQEPNYNLFGIKGEYNGQSVVYKTSEDDGKGNMYQVNAAFKKYPSHKESLEDYAKLMTNQANLYKATWKSESASYEEATKALTGVYATDTRYNVKLNEFIKKYELTEYDKAEPSNSIAGVMVADTHPDSDFSAYNKKSYPGSQSYAAGQCTEYAYNRISQLGKSIGTHMGNGKDWGETGKANGYEVTHKPKAGTAVSFQPAVAGANSQYGHVAFVEHVYEDGSILISEMNVVGLNVVSFRVLDKNIVNILTYITPK